MLYRRLQRSNMDLDFLAAAIRDDRETTEVRINWVHSLETSRDPCRVGALVDLATDQSLSPEVAAEVGRSVARSVLLADCLDDVPLADFSGSAYLGFDQYVARSQNHLSAS
jgi:hypothetical protein